MKLISTLFLSLLFMASAEAQQRGGFEFARPSISINSKSAYQPTAMVTGENDTLYTVGFHNSGNTQDFSNGDMFFVKYDKKGAKNLAVHFPRNGQLGGVNDLQMEFDPNGDLIIAGGMNMIFGEDTIQKYSKTLGKTIGVLKFDKQGNYIWGAHIDPLDQGNVNNFEMVILANGNVVIKGEGSITYKKDSTLTLQDKDHEYLALISNDGEVLTAYSAPYNLKNAGKSFRGVFANGNNIATFAFQTVQPNPGAPIFESRIKYYLFTANGKEILIDSNYIMELMGPAYHYELDTANNVLYSFTQLGEDSFAVFHKDTIAASEPRAKVIVKFDLNTSSVTALQAFQESIDEVWFTYPNRLTYTLDFLDSTTNLTTNQIYYPLPNASNGQRQNIMFNTDLDLKEVYHVQYNQRTGTTNIYDISQNKNDEIYGICNRGTTLYMDSLQIGNGGNAGGVGMIFKANNGMITSTFVKNTPSNHLVSVYPNPFNNLLTLDTKGAKAITVTFFDLLGKTIDHQLVNNTTISTDKLPKGVYLLSVAFTDNSRQTLRVVKL